MEYGQITGIDKPISRLVQGTIMVSSSQLEQSFALLDAIFALGCNAFDTARAYGRGENETVVGRWVNERGLRDQVVIIGKGAHPAAGRSRVTPQEITSDVHDSLAHFGFTSIDLYLLHRDDPAVPVGPIVEVLNEHHAAGRIHAFGGSNWAHQRIEEANEYAFKHNLVPFAASSPNISLAEQIKPPWDGCITISGPGNGEARAWYTQQKLPVIAWSSLAGGFFSGRFTRHNLDTFTEPLDKVCVDAYCMERNFQRLDRAQQLGQEKGVSAAQIAIAWVMRQPINIFAVVGCRTPDEFRDNLAGLDVRLSAEELGWLDLREP